MQTPGVTKIKKALFLISFLLMGCAKTEVVAIDPAQSLGAVLSHLIWQSSQPMTIHGTVSGLTGSGLVVTNNGGGDLAITAGETTFEFPGTVTEGTLYYVDVKSSPTGPDQVCTVNNGVGTVAASGVSDLRIICSESSYTVSGAIVNLTGSGLVLRNNSEELNVSGTSFSFAQPIALGSSYKVTVVTHPSSPWQTCSVVNDTGDEVSADVSGVVVGCSTNKYSIGGQVTGLILSNYLRVSLNGTADYKYAFKDGKFTFADTIKSGDSYIVAVANQPVDLRCIVQNGSGTVGGEAVSNVIVTCPLLYTNAVVSPSIPALLWDRCSVGQQWNAQAGDCTATGSSSNNYGATRHNYCEQGDDSCDDGAILTNTGTSKAYYVCNSYNLSGGTYGITGWKVLEKDPLKQTVYCSNGPTAPLSDYTGCSGKYTSPTTHTNRFPNAVSGVYWSSSSATINDAWYVDLRTGTANTGSKSGEAYVRCVTETTALP